MTEALAVGSFVALSLVPLTLAALAVAYLALRVRDARAEQPDPELGIKAAYHAFLTAGILLALSGLTLSVIDLLSEAIKDEDKRPQQAQANPVFPGRQMPAPAPRANDDPFDRVSQRVALPLVLSGTLFALVSLLLVKLGTNDARYPAVRRTFGGVRLAVAGLNVMVGGTLAIEILFQKDLGTTRPYAVALGLLIVWFPTAAIQLFALKKDGICRTTCRRSRRRTGPRTSGTRRTNPGGRDADREARIGTRTRRPRFAGRSGATATGQSVRITDPQVSPPPNATSRTVSPGFARPARIASSRAMGTDAPDVFP